MKKIIIALTPSIFISCTLTLIAQERKVLNYFDSKSVTNINSLSLFDISNRPTSSKVYLFKFEELDKLFGCSWKRDFHLGQ